MSLSQSLLAELLELLVPILETMASEAASLGLEVNWQKSKVQALGCREDIPLTIKDTLKPQKTDHYTAIW